MSPFNSYSIRYGSTILSILQFGVPSYAGNVKNLSRAEGTAIVVSSPTTTSSPQIASKDPQMNLKYLIPIIVGTFLISTIFTILAIWLYVCNKRNQIRYQAQSQNHPELQFHPSTPQGSPFVQSPSSTTISPISTDGSNYGKDRRIGSNYNLFGNVLVQEAGSGRRTPQEVLGDTTWGKGDLSPGSSRMSAFARSPPR